MTKETESQYINRISKELNASDFDKKLFYEIARLSASEEKGILKKLSTLEKTSGLTYALLALYRQQVNSGFVLSDPLKPKGKSSKDFFHKETGITFNLQWNPDRELRKNHKLLIKRGVIAENIDSSKLINKDKDGKACYLCKANIDLQNPGEITFEIHLAGERHYIGVNFAYIKNNHFVVMPEDHRPQNYNKNVLKTITDFLDKTGGYFRVIFNGLAGASILVHEHLQATTEKFPIEDIRVKKNDILFEEEGLRVSKPNYYTPVIVIEGKNRTKLEEKTDNILKRWHKLDELNNTENIIGVKYRNDYRLFIFLRDKRKLSGAGRKGAIAAFETGGLLVFSCKKENNTSDEIDEEETYRTADLNIIKLMLKSVSPEKEILVKLFKKLTFLVD